MYDSGTIDNYSGNSQVRSVKSDRKTLLFVSQADVMTDCVVYAIEREFPSLALEQVDDLQSACRKFRHPVALVLIDAALAHEFQNYDDRLQSAHPSSSAALLLRDNRHAHNILEGVFASKSLRGVVPMDLRLDLWLTVLRLMLNGGEYIPASLAEMASHSSRATASSSRAASPAESEPVGDPFGNLTDRQMEILKLVAAGNQNKVIAAKLGLSECTVKIHLHHLIGKLGARNRTEAAALYHKAHHARTVSGTDSMPA